MLKAAIFKNAEKNNPNFEDESPKRYQQSSGFTGKFNGLSDCMSTDKNPEDVDSESTNENSDSSKIEKYNTQSAEKLPLRLMTTKRFSFIEGKGSTGNSPTIYSPTILKKLSANYEESKSP